MFCSELLTKNVCVKMYMYMYCIIKTRGENSCTIIIHCSYYLLYHHSCFLYFDAMRRCKSLLRKEEELFN